MHLASVTLVLFLVLDPFGNIVPVHTVMRKVPPERRTGVLLRETLIALALLLFFLFAGSWVLNLLAVRQDALQISGGILLLLIAIGMVFPGKSVLEDGETAEPFIVPIAVPLLAGPSAIALLLTYSSKHGDEFTALLMALLMAWAGTALVLLAGERIVRLLGNRGTQAMERLMGLLLVLIGVQMLLDGVSHHLGSGKPETPAVPAEIQVEPENPAISEP